MKRHSALIVAAGILLAATACATDEATVTDPDTGDTAATTESDNGTTPPTVTTLSSTIDETSTTATTPTSDIGRFVRASDDGATLTLRIGETAVLVQADPFSPDPVVTGDAIDLVEMVSVAGTGDRRWEIRAIAAGVAKLDVRDGETAFSITIEVVG